MPLNYLVSARRNDSPVGMVMAEDTFVTLDTTVSVHGDAINPVEILLYALAECLLKGMERVAPLLGFQLQGAVVRLHGIRANNPPRLSEIRYEIEVTSKEPDERLALLHRNILKFGTIANTLGGAVPLNGTLRRAAQPKE